MSKPKPGQCYLHALTVFLDSMQGKDCLLVHGYPTLVKDCGSVPAGTKFGHAWLEIGERHVLDIETMQLIPRDIYYDVGRINETELTRYNQQEVQEMCLKHGHYGPWNEAPADAAFAVKGKTK